MSTNSAASSDAVCQGAEVMASVEEESERLLIADICTEDAWLSTPLGDAAALPRWR